MIVIVAIAIAAGAASALMFASIISGALISLLLLYLAPLPLMVAALGWGPRASAIGGIVASSLLGLLLGVSYGAAFALTVALPAWWLGHLVLLGRPVTSAASTGNGGAVPPPAAMEWYPTGRILLWIACIAIAMTAAVLLTYGSDAETIAATMKRGFLRFLQRNGIETSAATERGIEGLITIAPGAAAIGAMINPLINLWLASKITAMSGRLNRPWPDLRDITLPPMTLVALCVAIAFCFTGGLLAMFAQAAAGALLLAYALVGFAVVHVLTVQLRSRALLLGLLYAITLLFNWPILALMAVVGLVDALFGVRARFMRARPPPLPTS
jgi:Predicted membrane protein (DUF2232)